MECWIPCTDILQANKKSGLKLGKNNDTINEETTESGYLSIWALFVFIDGR